ncbi:hypothetical protein ACFE04_000571 [Oxalis oulophora]
MDKLTLTDLIKKSAAEFPNRQALSVTGKLQLSHAQLQDQVERAAKILVAPVLILSVIMFLAVIRCRAIAAPLNPAYTAEEFEFYLSDSKSKLLITPPLVAGVSTAQVVAATKLNIPYAAATLSNNCQITLSLASSTESIDLLDSVHELAIVNDPSDEALFLHTSGTTSRPKGVPLTQLNLAASVLNIKSVYKLTESDSTVLVLPLFHVHGLLTGLLSPLAAGASVTLPAAGRFSASMFWSDMKSCNATWYTAVPTIHQILLDCHISKPEAVYPKLRFIRSCSAALAPSVMERLEESFGAPVLEAYAMTEAAHMMASNPLPEDVITRIASRVHSIEPTKFVETIYH